MTHIIETETEIIFFLLTLVVPKFIQEKAYVTARCRVMEIIRYQELLQKSKTVLGSVAEWSKALVLGTSHFDDVGSNPTAARRFISTFPRNGTGHCSHENQMMTLHYF